ncbi:hypothetical protein V1514DRAFT_349434 [Lipomyces japonicus]|uniref:uncharacterized protein n=1 Tax=Lipomyces japonicus TaxID=56871 RepID=UPI0034CF9559
MNLFELLGQNNNTGLEQQPVSLASSSPHVVIAQTRRGKVAARACLACREKKVKCDGVQSCSNCRTVGADCVFVPSKRGVHRRRDAVKSLKLSSSAGLDDAGPILEDEQSDLNDKEQDELNLAIHDDTIQHIQSELNSLQQQIDQLRADTYNQICVTSLVHQNEPITNSDLLMVDLPSIPLIHLLVNVYFDNFHLRHSLLPSKDVFISSLSYIRQAPLLHAMFAVACRSFGHDDKSSSQANSATTITATAATSAEFRRKRFPSFMLDSEYWLSRSEKWCPQATAAPDVKLISYALMAYCAIHDNDHDRAFELFTYVSVLRDRIEVRKVESVDDDKDDVIAARLKDLLGRVYMFMFELRVTAVMVVDGCHINDDSHHRHYLPGFNMAMPLPLGRQQEKGHGYFTLAEFERAIGTGNDWHCQFSQAAFRLWAFKALSDVSFAASAANTGPPSRGFVETMQARLQIVRSVMTSAFWPVDQDLLLVSCDYVLDFCYLKLIQICNDGNRSAGVWQWEAVFDLAGRIVSLLDDYSWVNRPCLADPVFGYILSACMVITRRYINYIDGEQHQQKQSHQYHLVGWSFRLNRGSEFLKELGKVWIGVHDFNSNI